MVGARSFPGNPYDGHTLAEQLEQTNNLLQDIGVKPTTAIVDLGYRGVDKPTWRRWRSSTAASSSR
jgi:IS5 family transposase